MAFVLALGLAAAATVPLAVFAFDTRTAQPGHFPDGWRLKVTRGTPDVTVINEPQGVVLHLKSRQSSFALERPVDVDLERLPFLTWKWKVTELPRGGDFRSSSTDDQAAQVIVAFSDRRILDYLWDTNAPQGLMQSASNIPLIHVIGFVCRSGAAEMNRWLAESHNVREDYVKAFGKQPPRLKGIRLQINSQHTGSSAESYFGDVAFRGAPM